MIKRNQPRKKTAPGADTRARLIEVAAEHFALHGFEAASQRAIQREAGVNPASAHYHFGSKEAMYRAVVETFIHGIQAQRVASLRAQSNQRTARARLRHLLYSYFLPSLSVGRTKTGYHYVVILARLSTESTEVPRAIFDELIQPVRSLYLKALGELFPDAPEADILEALAMGVTLMATLLTRRPPEGESLVPVEKAESDASRLAEFVAAGFESWFGSPGPSCERAGLAAKPLRPPASAAR